MILLQARDTESNTAVREEQEPNPPWSQISHIHSSVLEAACLQPDLASIGIAGPVEAEERGKVNLKLPWVVYLGGAGIKEVEAGGKGHSASWKGLAGFPLTPSVPVLGLSPEPSSMSTEDFQAAPHIA